MIDASMSMADLEEVLPANEFCRPIRWALVSMREIVAMPTDILKLSDKTEIPISRLKRKKSKMLLQIIAGAVRDGVCGAESCKRIYNYVIIIKRKKTL